MFKKNQKIKKEDENKPEHLKIGSLGEDIACRFLKQKGFKITERNYRKKWGEIDIVAEEKNILRFVEVKSVSRETSPSDVSRETLFEPEDAIQPWKMKRLRRAIQSYLLEKNISESTEWQFDIVAITIDENKKTAKVRFLENMVL